MTESAAHHLQEGRPTASMLRTLSSSSATSQDPNLLDTHENQQLPTPPSEPVSAPATGLAPTILTTSNVHGLSAEQTQQVLKEKEKEKEKVCVFFLLLSLMV